MSESQRSSTMASVGRGNGYVNGIVSSRNPATISEVDEFCHALGGKRPIHSILIANNGMAAVKFMRSVRTWAYETFGTEKAILLVAMATPEDMRINAEHIRIADKFVEVPGGTNNNNYANVQLIVETAEITHVDAVWPGWGHASENPELPDALDAKGIVFLGPPATSMAALGDKIGSSLIAQAAEVPTLPWSGSHVKIPSESCLVTIPDDVYREACVYTTEEAIASCQVVGYPAMIKASWGGGGKGIRKVHNDDEVRALFKQVQGEVPGSPVFIMKVASQSRHLEVQLLCDQYGNVAALHSRDCSIQRRHQKIIEEGPITVAPLETVKKLEQAARRLAKCVNYVGAATVEYLYSMESGEYYFLELNPRLQVEHPVTEWIAEINLPAAQVAVGMGIPLWQIPEIRRFYGMEYGGGYDAWRKTSALASPFDFDMAQSTRPKGHCVAVRVTSEDPDDGFKPTSGKVQELSFKSKPNVWAYFSVKSGGGIHEFSDSQFGHVFAFGESRALAIANMVLGLKEIQIRGEIRTNVDYTIDLLHASDYRENKIHTGWLDSRIAMRVRAERPPWYLSVVGGALFKASASSAAMVSDFVGYLEKGQIPPKHISLVHSQVSLNIEGSKYTIDMIRGGPGSYRLRMNESEIEAEIHTLRDGGLLMQLDGNSHVIYAEEEAAGTRLLIDGRTCLLQNDHDPSKLVAETPCKLLRYLILDGSHIDADTPYAEVEVMKMCMPLLSPASGVIHFKLSEGQAMQAGELMARLDLDDPSAVRKAEPFHGSFPVLGPPTAISGKVHQKCAASLNAARMILAGYEHSIDEVVQNLLNCLDSPQLPFLQWQECLAVLANRLPKDLKSELESKYKEVEGISSSQNVDFPAKILRGVLEAHLSSCTDKEKGAQERLVEPLMSVVKSYEGGRESHARVIVQSLFEGYLSVEELFSDNIRADVIERLRLQYNKDLLKVVDIVISHQGVRSKNKLILQLMEQLVYPNPAPYRDILIRFSALNHTNYSELALKASQLLEQTKLSELRFSIARSLSELEMFTEDGESMDTPKRKIAINERMEDLVSAPLAVEDALVGLFDHSDHTLQRRVVETYVRRLYQPYLVKGSVRMQWHRSGLIASWEFLEGHIERKNGTEFQMSENPVVENHSERKWGAMVIIKSLQFLPSIINAALRETPHNHHETVHGSVEPASFGNMMHISLVGINNQMSLLQDSGDEDQAQERINKLAKILKEQEVGSSLRTVGVGVISCIIQRDEGRAPMRHSFHWSAENFYYEEEPVLRHLEPPLSIYLELDKLKGYENIQYTPSRDRQWHLYTVVDKPLPIPRMFLRTLVRQSTSNEGLTAYQRLEAEITRSQWAMSFTSRSILRSLMAAMEELELNAHNTKLKSDHAHMYLYVVREQQIDDLVPYPKRVDIAAEQEESAVEAILKELAHEIHVSVGVRMHRLGVCEWEVKLWMASSGQANGAWRVVVTNVTGHTCTVHIYRELEDTSTHKVVVYRSVSGVGLLHGVPVNAQYQPLGVLDRKRLVARRSNTTYCYDFPLAFETALQQSWAFQFPGIMKPKDEVLVKVTELKFADQRGVWGTPLVPVERPPALNDVGMVAWFMEMSTPEFPSGRTILVVTNDVTFKAGSFGPREDAFFLAVTDLACTKKVPLIYLAANSGARIGVADEVKTCFKVGWSDESTPERGFQYVYLTPEDYARIGSSVIAHEIKLVSGETRWVIDTIVGKEDGLGVENLTGSGAIAGAYSRAYKETFTLTYVTGRTVGIGAYLARLGMRCIQRLDQPIILTGFSALNKLLGREVYSSHMQLGGPKIMATNGVVHLTVLDDLEGISAILKWLSYIPPYIGGALPILSPSDPPERPVAYLPENSCDPRGAICGALDDGGKWMGGIFDKDSFVETLEGWARTVVTGRAKLGGIPVGIVAVETQTVMQVIPADPGQLDSHERVVPQAGQVWFPDSATKTAQALLDFNREELPLFILANWRGFSGGQRDLFEGILQAGSTIVENLRTYKQPVFVYIPMMGELRGGAWVVVDSRINSNHIEMYADRTAKGNVLEPEGMIEIKFRTKELLECMGRLDQQLINLKAKLQEAKSSGDHGMVESLQQQIRTREKQLLPLYTQIATKFAELHDTSLRMAAKGVIREVVDWANSRPFFYRRLRRRISEESLIKTVTNASGGQLSHQSALDLIKNWFLDSSIAEGREDAWVDDEAFFRWKDNLSNYEDKLKQLQVQKVLLQLAGIGDSISDLQALPQGLAALLSKVEPTIRAPLIDELRKVLG
ncbi:acetyl-CoA carboxylase 1-like isoform X2 [Alnus glutinosa]|nr:acetyl-CoA carboxylase 1-like isoform X2 [Alnus glutinosa]XP_062145783.1 acetyl-CoA carboxylase 1-like isoform X2 [Alnus glutinosa]XP_062145789.1 acetyl-CoA carboxylase 1-like isoform X2 [Alnus glutinosa]XP_062145796.1 acetyl-CoA carboxylase 1-like isoform X2 [Alnus glutinosa]XP_062145802.1 acetyl-CoA carboxylase 1-like isoform X2 [Alnus glutinosa]